jgi:hypothetical protein
MNLKNIITILGVAWILGVVVVVIVIWSNLSKASDTIKDNPELLKLLL